MLKYDAHHQFYQSCNHTTIHVDFKKLYHQVDIKENGGIGTSPKQNSMNSQIFYYHSLR